MMKDLDQIRDQVSSKSREGEEKVRQLRQELQQKTALAMERIDQTNISLWQSMDDFDDEVSGKIAVLSEAIRETMESTETKINESAKVNAVIVRELRDKVDGAISKLDEKVERYRAEVNSSLEENFLSVSEMIHEVGSNLSQSMTAIDNRVENYTASFDSRLKQQQSQESFDFLRDQMEKNSRQLREYKEEINDLRGEVLQLKELLTATTTTEAPITTEANRKRKDYDWKKWIPSFVRP